MGKLGRFYAYDWVEVMDIHENEKGTWDELEKGLITRVEGRDHQDGAVNGGNAQAGCSRYYKVLLYSSPFLLLWSILLSEKYCLGVFN